MQLTENEKRALIHAAEDRARRALENGNETAHRIHMERADILRRELER